MGTSSDFQSSRDIAAIGAYVLGDAMREVDLDPITRRERDGGAELKPAMQRQIAICLAAGTAVGVAAIRAAELYPDVDWLAVFMGRVTKEQETDEQAGPDPGNGATGGPGHGESSGGAAPEAEGADGPAAGREPAGQ